MNIKLLSILFALVLSLNNVVSAEPDPKFYIFLCFGQSNMEGYPGVQEEDKSDIDARFKVLAAVDFANMEREKGKWYTAEPPLCRSSCGICPADYFGRTMVANLPEDVKVGIINVSVAGCKIELFDKNNFQSYADTAPSWMTGIIEEYSGNPYQHLVDYAKIAQKDGVIKGILLHQGETNSNDQQWPEKVKGIYNNLLQDLNLKAQDVPLLAGELVHADQKGACAGMNNIIAKLPEVISTSHVISSKGCESRTDRLHFAPAGYRELGKRFGEKMLSLMGIEVKKKDEVKTTIIPHESWDCRMPEGIPYPQEGEVVLEAILNIDKIYQVGQTQYGNRQAIVIKEGSVSGPDFQGTIEYGGLEYQLVLSNNVIEIEQILVLKADDGKYIYSRNAGTGPDKSDVRVVMDFEAPNESSSAWLNEGVYIASRKIDLEAQQIKMTVYKFSKPALENSATKKLNIRKPENIAYQSWNYRIATANEKQGEQILSELVTLAPSASVGASKRGRRNIIPITGGKVSGTINGKVLPGGADYQNLSNPVTIEARYLWEAENGEIIIVRNAGQFGKLVPDFEAKVDGAYSWLNSGRYLSSNPQMGDNGVILTMYKSK